MVEKDKETEEIVVHFEGWSSRYDELIPIRDHRLRNLSQEMLEKTVRVRRPKAGVTITYIYIVCIMLSTIVHNVEYN